jgi:hypothetical protein
MSAELRPAGDLNFDGSDDALETRVLNDGGMSRITLVGHDARTGRVLWTRTISRPAGHDLYALPLMTGHPAAPGVVLLDHVRTNRNGHMSSTLSITGLAGNGRSLWANRTSGTQYTDGAGTHYRNLVTAAYPRQLGPGATALVLQLYDVDERPEATTGAVRTVVVSGRDGRSRQLGPRLASEDTLPATGFVPDQTGDGYDDLYVADPGAAGIVTVYSGWNGEHAWTTTVSGARALSGYFYLKGIGAVTGASHGGRHLQDVLLLSATPMPVAAGSVQLPLPDPRTSDHGQAVLLAGGTGQARWTQPADDAMPLARTLGTSKPAVALVLNNARGLSGEQTAGVEVDAISSTGAALWTSRVAPDTDLIGDANDTASGITAGDIDGDGVLDLSVRFWSGQDQPRSVRTVNGATGRDRSATFGDPVSATLDGHGDDIVRIADDDDVIEAYDGATTRRLFRHHAPLRGVISIVPVKPVRQRCARLFVAIAGETGSAVEVLSGSGEPLWRTTAAADRAGGRVIRGSVSERCAATA